MNTPRNEDRLPLQHMREACDEVLLFTQNATIVDLSRDIMLRRALMMSIGIIGEAASRLSDAKRLEYPTVPWRDIISMRNYLFRKSVDRTSPNRWGQVGKGSICGIL